MSTRSYKSELREAQAESTRTRILEAVAEVLAEGVETLSIPAVAERAGVSVGTVYRHFGDKPGLLQGLVTYAGAATGTNFERIPENLDEVDHEVRKVFQHFEATGDLLRAAFASRIGREARLESFEQRLSIMEKVIRQLAPDLDSEDVSHLARVSLILTVSDTFREWKERLGLTADEAADEVMWTIRTLLKGVAK